MEREMASQRPPHVLCDDIIKLIDDCIGANEINPSVNELPAHPHPNIEAIPTPRTIHANPILNSVFPNYKHN